MTTLLRNLRRGRGLAGFAALTVAFMVLVILWGAVVRATGSGAGCGQHWPLCNGVVFPLHHPRLATVIEFTHRATTGVCSTLYFIVLIWTFVSRPRGDRARKAAVWSGVLIVTEALLGRALVIHGWVDRNTSDARAIMQCIHFTNTLLLLAAFALTWWWLRPQASPDAADTGTRTLAVLALAATILVGATGSVAALADTLFPAPSLHDGLLADFSANAPLLVRMRWLHPAASILSVLFAGWLALRLRSSAGRWLLMLLGLQVVLGVGDVLLLAPTWMQVLHLLGADLFWITLVGISADVLLPHTSENLRAALRYAAAD
ncbi:MAG TPA: COX15/CtaA family protein [Acidobacteriaceae bacterium]|jgi:cytochrome c oxidase assembly protein subunit 15